MRPRKTWSSFIGLLLPLSLGSCGAGFGSIVPSSSGTSMSTDEFRLASDTLDVINQHREEKGLAPLIFHPASAEVAFQYCKAMEARDFFAHIDPQTGADAATRAKNAGIVHDPEGLIDPASGNPFVGENLLFTTEPYPTGKLAAESWIGSPGHLKQIDAPLPVAGSYPIPPWTHCGIAVHRSPSKTWWTALFLRNPY